LANAIRLDVAAVAARLKKGTARPLPERVNRINNRNGKTQEQFDRSTRRKEAKSPSFHVRKRRRTRPWNWPRSATS